ncbi:hypothetical protein [Roseovarius sp. THAF27]|uniref:hypothetical protein n=1 Tax=Roseovarius sp. THAF27 TaxID=2587850 RepID=UPI00126954DD|nr:hypothetical protein [Roseovarius sp. THAF27]
MTRVQIIKAIEAFGKRHSIAPATVTSRAVGNSRLYSRLQSGGDCTTEIAQRLLNFMERHDAAVSVKPEDAA